MHPRNRFRGGYDFAKLAQSNPALRPHVTPNAHGDLSIDYADPGAVKSLNQALLREAYGLRHFDVPSGYLCPPIPGRSDYVHHLADLLGPRAIRGERGAIKVLDIGMGASCIYALIGASEYGWRFVGSEVDPIALNSARTLVARNETVADLIECRAQTSATRSFEGIILPGESFDLSMCNPPFHASAAEAAMGSEKKRRNLARSNRGVSNFGGRPGELWCRGGELGFVLRMIEESRHFRDSVRWFTSLVSKSAHLPRLQGAASDAGATEVRTIDMAQGQKRSRLLAWTYRESVPRASGKPARSRG